MQSIDNRNDFPSIGGASGFLLFAVDKVHGYVPELRYDAGR